MFTKGLKISDTTKTKIFEADFVWDWSKNMTKVLLCRFKQSFLHFNMLTVYKCSGTGLFRQLTNPFFWSLEFKKQMTTKGHVFFSKYSKFF